MASRKTVLRQIEDYDENDCRVITAIMFRKKDGELVRLAIDDEVLFQGEAYPIVGFGVFISRSRKYIQPVIDHDGTLRVCRYKDIVF